MPSSASVLVFTFTLSLNEVLNPDSAYNKPVSVLFMHLCIYSYKNIYLVLTQYLEGNTACAHISRFCVFKHFAATICMYIKWLN